MQIRAKEKGELMQKGEPRELRSGDDCGCSTASKQIDDSALIEALAWGVCARNTEQIEAADKKNRYNKYPIRKMKGDSTKLGKEQLLTTRRKQLQREQTGSRRAKQETELRKRLLRKPKSTTCVERVTLYRQPIRLPYSQR